MTETIERWEKKVAAAEEHAENVYADQVKRLEKQIEASDSKEAREVKHVERQVELDALFAKHHVDYLAKVIAHEVKKVEGAYAKLAEKSEKGEDDKALTRAAEHAARVEDDAERHIEKVAKRVLKALERDAKAAAQHVYVGLEKLGLDEEALGKKAVADADRVEKALANLDKKVSNN